MEFKRHSIFPIPRHQLGLGPFTIPTKQTTLLIHTWLQTTFKKLNKKTLIYIATTLTLTRIPNPLPRKCSPASSAGAPLHMSQSTSSDRPEHAPRVSSPDTL
ncbi:hypothetical protein GmHk_06G015389 [Glycine max]|nr:hypothetical protein GmHk_06G015389 [Glycine max]